MGVSLFFQRAPRTKPMKHARERRHRLLLEGLLDQRFELVHNLLGLFTVFTCLLSHAFDILERALAAPFSCSVALSAMSWSWS